MAAGVQSFEHTSHAIQCISHTSRFVPPVSMIEKIALVSGVCGKPAKVMAFSCITKAISLTTHADR